MPKPLAVYVHFPFCLSKCPYCDFASVPTRHIPHEAYAEAVLTELDRRCAAWPGFERGRMQAGSVYFGGGTPSLWKPQCVAKVLEGLEQQLGFAPEVEISLEANPNAAGQAQLVALHAAGVNRLSLGVQSFDDALLHRLGRTHSAKEAKQAANAARKAGFENLSVDLLYAVPGQSLGQACADAQAAVALGVEHLSLYALTLEEEALSQPVPMAKEADSLPSEDLSVAMRAHMAQVALEAGLGRYEVSNHALAGRACQHNLSCWRGGDYMGLGAGAVGAFIRQGEGLRWFNHRRWEEYAKALEEGKLPQAHEESLPPQALFIERAMLGLRLAEGVQLEALCTAFGKALRPMEALAQAWEADGFATYAAGRLRLSERGMDMHSALCLQLL